MKTLLALLLLSFASIASASEVLQFDCLESYQRLLKPVTEIEVSPDAEDSQKISLPEAKEYRGSLPESCEHELQSAGSLRIIQSKNQLYSIEMRFINNKPILMHYFAPNTISRMEVAFKKSGYAGSSFLSHINGNLMLNYFITRDSNRNMIETITYKSKETANYE